MAKKIIILVFLSFVVLSKIGMTSTIAIECDEQSIRNYSNPEELNKIVQLCTQKANELHSAANTLSSQIQYIDTQIYLATLKIQETQDKIISTQKEIEILGSRIEGLDNSLSYLSKLLLNKVVAGYKKRTVSLLDILFDSQNATDVLDRIKYMKTAQDSNQKLLVQVQETKLNFDEQKQLREDKKKQLDALQLTLAQQKVNLEDQQVTKKNLLTATENSESQYQTLLDKAKRELSGFSAFTQSAGGGLTTFGNGSNGWYFTQRDPAWGNMTLPGSSFSVLQAGCAVTSVAMVCKSYGQGVTPSTIVGNSSNFIGGDLWNWAFSCSGKSTNWISANEDSVKTYLKQNIPVILKIQAPSVSGLHFIVAWGWDDGANDAKIHDPFYGPDLQFSSRYNWSQVLAAAVIN